MNLSRESIALIVAGVAAFVLQIVLAPYISISAAMPNFVVVFVMLCAVVRAQSFGCVMPFVLGLLYDFLSGNIVGGMALALMVSAVLAARVFAVLQNDTLFMPLAVLALGSLMVELLYAIVLLAAGYNAGILEAFVFRALPCALYDSVVAFLLYPLAARFFVSSGPSSPLVATQLR